MIGSSAYNYMEKYIIIEYYIIYIQDMCLHIDISVQYQNVTNMLQCLHIEISEQIVRLICNILQNMIVLVFTPDVYMALLSIYIYIV